MYGEFNLYQSIAYCHLILCKHNVYIKEALCLKLFLPKCKLRQLSISFSLSAFSYGPFQWRLLWRGYLKCFAYCHFFHAVFFGETMTSFLEKTTTTLWKGIVWISFIPILPATATVSVSTYQTTTSTTTTVAPPGYDWFSDTNNAILFGSVMAFTAILSGKAGILKLHSL